MPVITIDAGKMSKEQKATLVKELATKASETLNIPVEAFVTIIRENDMDNIGNGTQLLAEKYEKR
ncbi:4-oxalocrotonate tautomerase DmpI [Desulfosporosinus sp.]|uniref:4-oxalocrotonate tautomerase DmpI n=1 Tax=Desulfosporosinus sp. TaxID=157907 RepID=UPI000E9BB34B|nr:4-oxalocrotonate tautomerase DmpI [Desulfosporosinus sp.]MBC2729072.1 tautomerase family protein [Desulfosporosinus sp.]HBV86511.1 4-oxalocrotonate tautomerase [Desulfosporosinus sp.]